MQVHRINEGLAKTINDKGVFVLSAAQIQNNKGQSAV